jgi:hypothetical protein
MNQTLPAPTLGASSGESMNVQATWRMVNGGKNRVLLRPTGVLKSLGNREIDD